MKAFISPPDVATHQDLSKGLISFEGKSVINKRRRKRLSLFPGELEDGTFKIQERKKNRWIIKIFLFFQTFDKKN
jgi:hypothetical protein